MLIAVLAATPARALELVQGSPWRAGDQFQLALSLEAVRQAGPRSQPLCRHEALASLTGTRVGEQVLVVIRPVRWWTGTGIGACEPQQLLHGVGHSFLVDDTGDVTDVKLQAVPKAARAALSSWSAEEQLESIENLWGGTFALAHAAAITPIVREKDLLLPGLTMSGSELTHDQQPCSDGVDRCARGVVKTRFEGTLEGKPVTLSTTEELLLDRQKRPDRYRWRKVDTSQGLTATFEIRFRPVQRPPRPPAAR